MDRITKADLEVLSKKLNQATNNPVERWSNDGKNGMNPGHIFTQGQYGYFTIQRISNEGGGCSDLRSGLTKREAYEWYMAALKGIELVVEGALKDKARAKALA